jgi:hypothetical protein
MSRHTSATAADSISGDAAGGLVSQLYSFGSHESTFFQSDWPPVLHILAKEVAYVL